jgi:hypothetical protein
MNLTAPTSSVFIKYKKKSRGRHFLCQIGPLQTVDKATSHMEMGVLQGYGSGMD